MSEVWEKLFIPPCPKCKKSNYASVYPSPCVWWTAPKELSWKCLLCGTIYDKHKI